MDPAALPRRQLARGLVLVAVVGLCLPTVVSGLTYDPSAHDFRRGTITEPSEGLTVVAIQGFHFEGEGDPKKPARLAAFGPRGELRWVYNGSDTLGARWFYDVDPLPDGNLLVTATNPDGTIVMSLDPATREPVWVERLPFTDTHDVDQLDGQRLLVANMRGYNETAGVNNDRVLIYDRTTDRVEWEWLFREHYPELLDVDTGGGRGGVRTEDWTHVNDVDEIAPGRYLVSVRNFDQVIVIDRATDEITLRLGGNDRFEVMREQHNPVYLESESGRPTVLVADSEQDRVVEYERRADGWNRTWTLSEGLSWPRDADRLPDGNTLVVDSLNHRVIEVTPAGRIVWEVYAPWAPYDAERIPLGDEAGGPTIADQGAAGNVTLFGSAGLVPGTGQRMSFAGRLVASFAGTPLEGPATEFARRWTHVTPWLYPVWMTGWDFAFLLAAVLIGVGWAVGEAVVARDRIAARLHHLRS